MSTSVTMVPTPCTEPISPSDSSRASTLRSGVRLISNSAASSSSERRAPGG